MSRVRFLIVMISMVALLLPSVNLLAETEDVECDPDEIFQACDTNQDGKISKEEWNTIDKDEDEVITSDEWDKYHYKSTEQKSKPFRLKYYDVYGDGTMGKEEFLNNFKRLQ
jgi:Ca2+-binding EF-hand superfamily protein